MLDIKKDRRELWIQAVLSEVKSGSDNAVAVADKLLAEFDERFKPYSGSPDNMYTRNTLTLPRKNCILQDYLVDMGKPYDPRLDSLYKLTG